MTEVKRAEFKLISHTEMPLETLFAAWAQSRPTKFVELFDWIKENKYSSVATAHCIKEALELGIIDRDKYLETVKSVSMLDLPIAESIHFTWGFSNLPIEWREQAVRKRQWGFWLTSMREFGMGDYADEGRYAPPPEGRVSKESIERFHEMIAQTQDWYNELIELGWPQEKARKIVVMSATHNGTMFSNFRTLVGTLSSRSCWIAQLDLWGPVLKSVVFELSRIDPILGQIVSPPCFARFSNEFKGCKYDLINKNRIAGSDPYPVCPLYAFQKGLDYNKSIPSDLAKKESKDLLSIWSSIWKRNPHTGKLL